MKVFILRGLPGSGKTTWIKNNLLPDAVVCSADHFHMVDGVYRYDPANAGKAHAACLRKYLENTLGWPLVHGPRPNHLTVDNTNCTIAEIAPYAALATAYDVPFEVVHVHCTVAEAVARNVHGVPDGTILDMARRLATEPLPPWWKIRLA
jgi:predicted kinase